MWSDDVKQKIRELEAIAKWAAIVNLGQARDSIRDAEWHLKKELESSHRIDEVERLRAAFNWLVDELHGGLQHARELREVSNTHETQIDADAKVKAWSQAVALSEKAKQQANQSA